MAANGTRSSSQTFNLHSPTEDSAAVGGTPGRLTRRLRSLRVLLHPAIDVLMMNVLAVITTVSLWGTSHLLTSESLRLGFVASIAVVANMMWSGLYERLHGRRWPAAVAVVIKSVVLGAAVFSLAGFLAAIGGGVRRWLLVVAILWIVVLGVRHGLWAARQVGTTKRRVIVAGSPRDAVSMRIALRADRRCAYDVVGFVVDRLDDTIPPIVADMALGSIDDLPHLVVRHQPDQVMFCMSGLDGAKFAPLARELTQEGIGVSLTGLGDVAVRRVALNHVQGRPVVYIAPASRSGWSLFVKRTVDVVVASILLVVLAPLLVLVAVMIKLVDRQSPIFRQKRVGKGGELFKIYKFRSMIDNSDELTIDLRNDLDGPLFKMRGDPRITKVGAFIRKTSIDELPQLWNVVKGDMSLVGPRPLVPSEVAAAPERFRDREVVTPGMTGRWQVSGRSDIDFDELDELDRWYVDNWSLGQDLGILAKTVPAVLLQRGAR